MEADQAVDIFNVVDRNREYLREWLPWVDATKSPEDIRDFIRRTLLQFANNEGFSAGIWRETSLLGVVGFLTIDWINNKVEIGYWIAQDHQRKGIMNVACRSMIDHAFRRWKLNRVEIRCAVGNLPSNRVAQKLGFQLEGTLRGAYLLYGTYHNLNVYGMLAGDWGG